MAASFSHLLNKRVGSVKPPPALEPGTYYGRITGFDLKEPATADKSSYVRFMVQITAPGDGVEIPEGVDLSKKLIKKDFYITEAALHRLDKFMASFEIPGADEKTQEEILPFLVNQDVICEVTKRPDKEDTEVYYNDINAIAAFKG